MQGLDLQVARRPHIAPPVSPEESFLSWWRIALTDTPSIRHLGPALQVRRLVLDWSGLTDEAVVLLSLSTTLTDLSLSSNDITDAGARTLAAFPALVRLDLHSQNGPIGLTDTSAEALSQNTSLTSLDLSENRLTPASVNFFLKNTALTSLKLYRSVFPFFSHPPSNTLEQRIARNKLDVTQRRKVLLQFLFTVARQKRKGQGPFASIPVDIIVHTMRFFHYKDFGKTTLQLQSICHFIFSKVDWLNRHLEAKLSMRIQERPSSALLPDNAPSKLQLISLYLDS